MNVVCKDIFIYNTLVEAIAFELDVTVFEVDIHFTFLVTLPYWFMLLNHATQPSNYTHSVNFTEIQNNAFF